MANPALRVAPGVEAGADGLALRLLVLRCQTGDEAAFRRLMEMFEVRTLRYLRGIAGDDADDVQQEVWLSVYRHVGTLADAGAFRTWLYRTTRHRAIDWLRRRKREYELIDDVPLEEVAGDAVTEPGLPDEFDEASMAVALQAIPPPQREVILLRYRDDLSYEEIARVVGCPIGTVRTRLHHGKRKIELLMKREIP